MLSVGLDLPLFDMRTSVLCVYFVQHCGLVAFRRGNAEGSMEYNTSLGVFYVTEFAQNMSGCLCLLLDTVIYVSESNTPLVQLSVGENETESDVC